MKPGRETEVAGDNKIQDSLAAGNFARFHILLVEDHPFNMLFTRKILENLGFERIDEVGNGAEALRRLDDPARAYDLVLMDCQMPEMDGFTACRKRRDREKAGNLKKIPIIAMTADAQEDDRHACIQAGMNDYISKPFNQARLYEVLSRWLPEAEKQAGSPGQEKESIAAIAVEQDEIVDLSHLNLLTGGDPGREKMLSDVFIKAGADCLKMMRKNLTGEASDDDWRMAAHKMKGSSAQLGANALSALCSRAEREFRHAKDEKRAHLNAIENALDQIVKYFEARRRS